MSKFSRENRTSNSSTPTVNALQELFCRQGQGQIINTDLSSAINSTFGTRLTVLTLKTSKVDLMDTLSKIFNRQIQAHASAEELDIILRLGMGFNGNYLSEYVEKVLKACPTSELRKKRLHPTIVLLSIVQLCSKQWREFDDRELNALCLRVRNFYESGLAPCTPTEMVESTSTDIATTPKKGKRKLPPDTKENYTGVQKRVPTAKLKQKLFKSPPLGSSNTVAGMGSRLPVPDHLDDAQKSIACLAEEFLVYKYPSSYARSQLFFAPEDTKIPSAMNRTKAESSSIEVNSTPKMLRIQD